MEKLIIKIPGAPVYEMELAPGLYKIGRAATADLPLDHPSVSGAHCEMMVGYGVVALKDLGSTNGIMLDGRLTPECRLTPGQAVRLGDVELAFAPANLPPAPAQARFAPVRPKRRSRSFYKSIPGAFVYPFKRNGILLLIAGTLVFGAFDFVITLRVGGRLLVGLIVGGLFGAAITGYLFLYMQSIINSSAQGDDKLPNWPDFESAWESAFQPFLRLMGIGAACVAPAIGWAVLTGVKGQILILPLLIAGCCYAPMSLLAVAIDDSLLGLNPLLVIPAIVRVPLEYLVSCLVCGALFFLVGILGAAAGLRLPPLAGQILGVFFALYFSIVQMRLLGLLYYCKKDRFGWQPR